MNLLDEAGINFIEQSLFFGGHIENQCRFCNGDPYGAGSSKLVGELHVGLHSVGHEILGGLLAVIAGEAQEGVNADEARNRLDVGGLGFVVFLNGLVARKGDDGGIVNFRDNVVVVGVEPLFHGEGLHVALFALVTVGRSKIGFESRNAQFLVAGRHCTQQERSIQDVIVEREVVGRNEVDSSGLLLLPTVLTDFGGDLLEFGFRDFALEELFASELEFTCLTDTRETNHRSIFRCHIV